MREFPHYAVWDEALEIVRDVAETHRLTLIPDAPQLRERHIETYDAFVPEVAEKLAQFRVLHLEGEFTEHPLEFGRRETGSAAGTYYVDFMSGPRLRWVLPEVNTTGRPTLTPGTLSYLSRYRNPETNEWEGPSDELVRAFADVVATMKRHLVQVGVGKQGKVKIWIGRESKRQLDEGKLFVDV